MVRKSLTSIRSEVLTEGEMCTLEQLCLSCNVAADWIVELVEHGVIEPVGQTKIDWQFTRLSIVRVAKAKRLERDLELNAPGVALVLDLLDEIDHLRSRLLVAEPPGADEVQP